MLVYIYDNFISSFLYFIKINNLFFILFVLFSVYVVIEVIIVACGGLNDAIFIIFRLSDACSECIVVSCLLVDSSILAVNSTLIIASVSACVWVSS